MLQASSALCRHAAVIMAIIVARYGLIAPFIFFYHPDWKKSTAKAIVRKVFSTYLISVPQVSNADINPSLFI